MFLRNQWYVAAWSHEVSRELFSRRIAGEPIVFWRTRTGQAVAFEDFCPHRFAPLSKGKLIADTVQCSYHGVTFDSTGKCIRVPGQEKVPSGCNVRAYRLEERWGWIWLWLGAAENADTSLIPDFHWQSKEGWAPTGGLLHFKGHYQLLVDNLLDLSHETFLHQKSIGNDSVAEAPAQATTEGNRVRVKRMMRDVPAPPLFVKARGFKSHIDRLQDITFEPPCYVNIHVRATPVGSNDDSEALEWHVLNALTPETESSTHYFWGLPRNFSVGDREMDKMLEAAATTTFQEDQDMIEAQQLMLAHRALDSSRLAIRADAGVGRARNIIARLATAERGEADAR